MGTLGHVPATQIPQQPILAATEAVLYVADFRRSCDYFKANLGFEIEFAISGDGRRLLPKVPHRAG